MGALWAILRVCGIIVGIATMLRLATLGFNVEYKEFFQAFLDQVRNIVELGFLIDPLEKLVHATLEWVRSFGWYVPELQAHWRSVFTLMWLMLAATARNEPRRIGVSLVWAFFCALVAAVAAGTKPFTSFAVFGFPVACAFLYFALWFRAGMRFTALGLGVASFFAAYSAFSTDPWTKSFGFVTAGPGLLYLVVTVGGLGLTFFAVGLFFSGGTLRERLAHPLTAMGLDIMGVIGGALAIGYLMLK